MSEQVKDPAEGAGAATPAADPLKNLKAEMDRKLGNLEQTNAQLLAMMQKMSTPAPKKEMRAEPKLADIWFDKPEEAAEMISRQAEERIKGEFAKQQQQQQKQQTTIRKLVDEYPELATNDSDLTKRAVELFDQLPAEDQTHPLAYQSAVKDAAIELGIKPKRLRKGETDDFVMSGSGTKVPRSEVRAQEQAIDYLGKAFGLDMDDKRKDRIKNKHGRRNYTNWE